MSGWYVLPDRDLAGIRPGADSGRALLYFHRQIDELAAQLELPALSDFFCPDRAELFAYLREQGVAPDEEALPEEEWFDAKDGLLTVRGLLARLREDSSGIPSPATVISDLEEIERGLDLAEAEGVRFHLARKLPLGRELP